MMGRDNEAGTKVGHQNGQGVEVEMEVGVEVEVEMGDGSGSRGETNLFVLAAGIYLYTSPFSSSPSELMRSAV